MVSAGFTISNVEKAAIVATAMPPRIRRHSRSEYRLVDIADG